MTFQELNIIEPILEALKKQGYTTPTPIQQQAIPILLEGKDLLGCAQTGTGKTAAFSIPILQNLHNNPHANKKHRKIRALIITPTRELAIQIGESFTKYARKTNLINTVIFGGVKQTSQVKTIRQGVDIIVATPGRLLDLIQQEVISLHNVEYFVLDEADQMLDMGFIHSVRQIIAKLPQKRQSLFFSATMSSTISKLADNILDKPTKIAIEPQQTTAEKVSQEVYFVTKQDKVRLLADIINKDKENCALVFSRTKHGANKIVKLLEKVDIKADAIHGNKSQNARQKALEDFKNKEIKILIATDIAARGIDISELPLVINYDLPNLPETYVHRIGRTGRAQASGIAISFCDNEERGYLRDIQKLIGQIIPAAENNPYHDDSPEQAPKKQSGGGNHNRSNHSQRHNKDKKPRWDKKKIANNKSRNKTNK